MGKADRSRDMRMAIGIVALGCGPACHTRPIASRTLIRDAIERCGFKASNNHRFTGRAVITGECGVYAIGAVGLGVVKIGWSEDIARRRLHIENGLPTSTILLGYIRDGTMKTEKQVHREMKQWHHKGEWFWLTAESRAFICERFNIKPSDEVVSAIGMREII